MLPLYDRLTIKALIEEITSRGSTDGIKKNHDVYISISDGDHYQCKHTRDIDTIYEAMSGLDECWVMCSRMKGITNTGEEVEYTSPEKVHAKETYLGQFYLIYANGYEPMDTITDHTANDWCDGIHKRTGARFKWSSRRYSYFFKC